MTSARTLPRHLINYYILLLLYWYSRLQAYQIYNNQNYIHKISSLLTSVMSSFELKSCNSGNCGNKTYVSTEYCQLRISVALSPLLLYSLIDVGVDVCPTSGCTNQKSVLKKDCGNRKFDCLYNNYYMDTNLLTTKPSCRQTTKMYFHARLHWIQPLLSLLWRKCFWFWS